MTINAQSGVGKIRLFNDFFGGEEQTDAETEACVDAGDFKIVGDTIADTDTQQTTLDTDGLSGVLQLETTDVDKDSTALATAVAFDVALMRPLIIEARVRFAALTTRVFFLGFANTCQDDLSIEDDLFDVTAVTTIENTATNITGFLFQSELTESTELHCIYKGGANTSSVTTTNNELDVVLTAGEWMLLRLEIDPNGTARWFADGALVKTQAGAASTTTDLAALCGVGSVGGTQVTMDVDYLLVEANRDWNA